MKRSMTRRMIRIRLLGFSVALVLNYCNGQSPISFSKIQKRSEANFSPEYKAFCLGDTANYELAAVSCSFFGEYEKAIQFATKEAIRRGKFPERSIETPFNSAEFISSLKSIVENPTSAPKDVTLSKKLLGIYTRPKKYRLLFGQTGKYRAVEVITTEAKKYHYVLINEAHYSSLNRNFTQSLLKSLWEQGYRYLALETLQEDSIINKTGFPTAGSGYYLTDATFGNLIREAFRIGYKLVAYEARQGVSGSERDDEQAMNLFKKTWLKDPAGKVLVHAGYDHISKFASPDYKPMAARLIELIGQDVLSIDQERMQQLLDKDCNYRYYNFVNDSIGLKEPIIFTDTTDIKGLVDEISSLGIDFQIYSPPVKFIHGRPDWLYTGPNKVIDLPIAFNKYAGCLIKAIPEGEPQNASPIDQIIFQPGKVFLLPSGRFNLYIIDKQGTLVGTCTLKVP